MDYTKRSIKKDRRTVMQDKRWMRFVQVDLDRDEEYRRTHTKTRRAAELASAVVADILDLPNDFYTRGIGIGCMNLFYCGNETGF